MSQNDNIKSKYDGMSPQVNIYQDRIKEVIKLILTTPLKISNIKKILYITAQKQWELEREKNNDKYSNLLNRILNTLHKNQNFDDVKKEGKNLNEIISVLGEEKGQIFLQIINEYHKIYHNPNLGNKTEILLSKREIIERSLAHYVAKSKENFISKTLEDLEKTTKLYFIIREDSPKVKKSIIEKKQRRKLKKLFEKQNKEILEKINLIKDKYLSSKEYSFIEYDQRKNIVDLFIKKIIENDTIDIDDILKTIKPERYDEYILYLKVSKIINRLNSGYIKYNDVEVSNYIHLIEYTGNMYIYKAQTFSNIELEQIEKYIIIKRLLKKIKVDLFKLSKTIEVTDKTTKEELDEIECECEFNDENYVFNNEIIDKIPTESLKFYADLINEFNYIIKDNDIYQTFLETFIHSGLILFCLINELLKKEIIKRTKIIEDAKISGANTSLSSMTSFLKSKDIESLILLTSKLILTEGKEEINFENIERIINLKEMNEIGSPEEIAILGKDIAKKVYKSKKINGFQPRVKIASDLVSRMLSRRTSSVPYVNGTNEDFSYSIYDPLDITLLTAGIEAKSCFQCGHYDNDFVHFCALNKNGFSIKITDSLGFYNVRASGGRNGNGIYINQLIVAYNKSTPLNDMIKKRIVETFKKACDDIVKTSQENPEEKEKIDFVIVTQSMLLSKMESNVSNETQTTIGSFPYENESKYWKDYVMTTPNINQTKELNMFKTDYIIYDHYNGIANYKLICISSVIGNLTKEKIKKGDVPALYERKRNDITMEISSEEQEEKINRIKAINAKLSKKVFKPTKIKPEQKIITGDNWFIIIQEKEIIEGSYLESDEMAKKEFELAIEECELSKRQNQDINLEHIKERIKTEFSKTKTILNK